MASGVSEASKDYVVTYQAEEITDTDALIQLALEQSSQKAKGRSAIPENESQLEVTQLLETREYADGTIQSDYSETGIIVMDAVGRAVKPQSDSGSDSGYGAFLTATTYYTVYEGSDPINYPEEYVIIVSRVVANVSYNGGAVKPSNLYFNIWHNPSANGYVYCTPSTTQSYTYYTDNNQYFGPTHVLRIQTTLTLSNGSSIFVHNVMYNK